MKLKQYLRTHGITMLAFGQRFNPPVSPGKVNHWLRGTRRVSLEEALQIEVLTGGEVAPRDLVCAAKQGQVAIHSGAHGSEANA